MKLVFTCKIEVESQYDDVFKEISIHMSKFYNMTLYEYKMENLLSQNDYYGLFKDHMRSGYLQTHTYIHAIKQAIEKDVKVIVIGDVKNIKTENKQKYFVQIPHSKLIRQIIYKAKLVGIHTVMQNESYTSSVSSLDLEKVDREHADKSRRFKRGLFKTTFGVINSDINGSLNIMRKYTKDKNIPRLITQARGWSRQSRCSPMHLDKGLRENPIRLLVI